MGRSAPSTGAIAATAEAVLRPRDPASLRTVTPGAFAAMLVDVRRCAILVSAAIVLVSSPAFAEDPADPPADYPHLALGAGGHVTFGTAPAVAIGTRVSAEVATRGWSLGIEGRYDAPASLTLGTSLVGGSFVPCLRTRGAWACVVMLASRITVEQPDATDERLFVGIGGRFEQHFPLPFDFALRLVGEVLMHPIRYDLVVQGHAVKSSVVSALFGPSLVHAF